MAARTRATETRVTSIVCGSGKGSQREDRDDVAVHHGADFACQDLYK